MSIMLPSRFQISRHAAERFIERIIGREEYNEDDIYVAQLIIQNILARRLLKSKRIDQYTVRLKYRNAVFIYDIDQKTVVTAYHDEKAREKVEWAFKFPAGLKLDKKIAAKMQIKLITYGFTPLKKEGRILIGEIDGKLFQYDLKLNYISFPEKALSETE